jgi:hypothetical protein
MGPSLRIWGMFLQKTYTREKIASGNYLLQISQYAGRYFNNNSPGAMKNYLRSLLCTIEPNRANITIFSHRQLTQHACNG